MQRSFPSLCREYERHDAKVDKVERSEELIWERLRNVLLEESYLPDLRFAASRIVVRGDVTNENLNVAITDARQGEEIKRPSASPSTNVDDSRDLGSVDSSWDELRIVEYAVEIGILLVHAVRSMSSSYLWSIDVTTHRGTSALSWPRKYLAWLDLNDILVDK